MRNADQDLDLKHLQSFEVVARQLSFTRAAEELRLLQPAVSRQIASLEQAMGTALFVRSKPRLTLTSEGEVLYATVSASLSQIRSTVREIASVRQAETLVVDTSIGLVSCYLMDHLDEFYSTYPDIELELVTRDQNSHDLRYADIVTLFADDAPQLGVEARLIVPETLVAVCSPDYLSGDQPPFTLEQLTEQKLLFMDHVSYRLDWQRYLSGSGLAVAAPNRARRFTSFMVYLQAAINGGGVVLTLEKLVARRVANSRLRLACEHKVATGRGYYACLMARGCEKPAATLFMNWLAGLER